MSTKFWVGVVVGALAVGALGVVAELPAYRCEQFGRMIDAKVVPVERECYVLTERGVISRSDLERAVSQVSAPVDYPKRGTEF